MLYDVPAASPAVSTATSRQRCQNQRERVGLVCACSTNCTHTRKASAEVAAACLGMSRCHDQNLTISINYVVSRPHRLESPLFEYVPGQLSIIEFVKVTTS